MSSSEPAVAYPPPSTAPAYYVTPPPAGYPKKDGSGNSQNPPLPVETRSRGNPFVLAWHAFVCCFHCGSALTKCCKGQSTT